jgi:hypothetical protein
MNHFVEHWKHVPFRHRFIASLMICGTSFIVYFVTHNDVWFKAFELSVAPFLDKAIFGAME